ncbi:hypothetical protein GF336_02585 [Candidatus Woesearchaeota archaeon]|nr:hypothetical protein [Candidatus Woesearchaeota archaeon]
MAILEETGQALISPLVSLWDSFVSIIPGLIGAIVVLVIGYIVGWAFGLLVKKVLQKVQLDKFVVEKTNLQKSAGKFELSRVVGLVVKWYIFVLFLTPAAALVNLEALSEFLVKASLWIPNLIAAVLVAVIGFIAADYVASKVEEIKSTSSKLIAYITKIIIVIFTLIIALNQLGIDVSVAESSFLIILAGIMLALAIGFGLALKDESKPIIKKMMGKI